MRKVLGNGVHIVVWPDASTPVVAIRAVWPGGLLLEDPRHNGITQLLARVLPRSCRGLKSDPLDALTMHAEGQLGGVSGRDTFGLHAEWPATRWEQAIELVSRCLLAPDLDDGEIARQRRGLIDERIAYEDDPGFTAFMAFARTLYQAHPYRLSPIGEVDTLAALDRATLAAHYEKHYPISGLIVTVVGDVDPREIIARIEKLLGHVPARAAALPARPREVFQGRPDAQREAYHYLDGPDGRARARLVIGFPGTTQASPDHHALELAMIILAGRLSRALDVPGLAQWSEAYSVAQLDAGYAAAQIACRPDQLDQVFPVARDEILSLISTPPDGEEVERARRVLLARDDRARVRPASVAAALAFQEILGVGLSGYRGYRAAVARVTPGDIVAVAGRYLSWDRAVFATAMPRTASPAALRRMDGIRKLLPRRRRPSGPVRRRP